MPSLTHPDRRDVLRLIAAGAAASLARCSKPDQPIYPRAIEREGGEPGQTLRYATTIALAGYGRGVTGLVVDGRPIKLEGLAAHPASLGATDMFAEAAILDLYDPQRLRAPIGPQGISGWSLLQQQAIARLAGSDGSGLRLLTGRVTSPTLLARIAAMRTRFPAMRYYRAEPIDDDTEQAGATLAFGRVLTMRPRLAEADVIVALDADPLGPGPDQIAWARAWATRRNAAQGPQRMHVIEPSMTQTGMCADHRTAATPAQIADTLLLIAAAFGAATASPNLPPEVAGAVDRIIRDMKRRPGRAILLVGRGQPARAHALAAWINQQCQAPTDWIEPIDPDPLPHGESLAALAGEMHAGRVSTLVVLDADPLHHAPSALGFGAAMARVPFTLVGARFPSATSFAATWAAPLSDPLESWGDLRATDGTASLVQPLVRPLYRTRSATQLLDLVDPGAVPTKPHDHVQATWQHHGEADFNLWWRDALVAGIIPNSAAAKIDAPHAGLHAYPPSAAQPALVLTLAPSPTLWDGRFATNAWTQECPDPLTKEVWGSALRISAADAAHLHLAEGAIVALDGAGETAVRIVEGQAPGVATLLLGHGRRHSGAIADVPGANGFALRSAKEGWTVIAPLVTPVGHRSATTTTQGQFDLDGDLARLFPVVTPGTALPPKPPEATLLLRNAPGGSPPPQWAMAIDTSICIGCNACVVACQAENNVPAIGPEEMARNRDMHWLRVDRYEHNGGGGFQPVPCMQCETAPCEPVCPVEASVHDSQGLNVQVYNRCVGTRTCQANCPYKVRRFNFLDYAGADLWHEEDHASITAQRNPDVTVRARGVMEKCSYCVQRIETATHEADATGNPRGAVVTACQSACPTQAIRFGDMTDAGSGIPAARADPRHYALLGELGTRPRTTYLAKVRNPADEP